MLHSIEDFEHVLEWDSQTLMDVTFTKTAYLIIADFEDDVDNNAIDNIVDQFLAQKGDN